MKSSINLYISKVALWIRVFIYGFIFIMWSHAEATSISIGETYYYGPLEISSDIPYDDGWVVQIPEDFYTSADAENSRGEVDGRSGTDLAWAQVTWAGIVTKFSRPDANSLKNQTDINLEINDAIYGSAATESVANANQLFQVRTRPHSNYKYANIFIKVPNVTYSIELITDKYGVSAAFRFDALLELWEINPLRKIDSSLFTSGNLVIGPNSELIQSISSDHLVIWGKTVKTRTDYLAVVRLDTFGEVFNIPAPDTMSLIILGCSIMAIALRTLVTS